MDDKQRSDSDIEEETRRARAGETGLTRFGMEESSVAETPATGGPTVSDEETKDEEAK